MSSDFDLHLYFSHRRRLQEAGLIRQPQLPPHVLQFGQMLRSRVNGRRRKRPLVEGRRVYHNVGVPEFVERAIKLGLLSQEKWRELNAAGLLWWESLGRQENISNEVANVEDIEDAQNDLNYKDPFTFAPINEEKGVVWLFNPSATQLRGLFFQADYLLRLLMQAPGSVRPILGRPIVDSEIQLVREMALHAVPDLPDLSTEDPIDYPLLFLELAKFWLRPDLPLSYENDSQRGRAISAMTLAFQRDAFDALSLDVSDENTEEILEVVVFTPDENPVWDEEFRRTFNGHVNLQRRTQAPIRQWKTKSVRLRDRQLRSSEAISALEQAVKGGFEGKWLAFWLGKGEVRLANPRGVGGAAEEGPQPESIERIIVRDYFNRNTIQLMLESGTMIRVPQATKLRKPRGRKSWNWGFVWEKITTPPQNYDLVLELDSDALFFAVENIPGWSPEVTQRQKLDAFYDLQYPQAYEICGILLAPDVFHIRGYPHITQSNAVTNQLRLYAVPNPTTLIQLYLERVNFSFVEMNNDRVVSQYAVGTQFSGLTIGQSRTFWERVRNEVIPRSHDIIEVVEIVYFFNYEKIIDFLHYGLFGDIDAIDTFVQDFLMRNNLPPFNDPRIIGAVLHYHHPIRCAIRSVPTQVGERRNGLRLIKKGEIS